jgi:formate hydrogenlyase transcriptional activator
LLRLHHPKILIVTAPGLSGNRGKPFETETRVRRFDGESHWFLSCALPLFDRMGNILGWYGNDIDIQDRKQAEEKLRQDEMELRRITDAIPQAITVLGPEGNAVYANRVALEYTGLTLEDVNGGAFRTQVTSNECETNGRRR